MLPLLAHATTAVHDPTDAGACVPAVTVQSAFDGYKSWQDGEAPIWQQLNRAVAPSDLTSTPATQTQPAPGAGFAVARWSLTRTGQPTVAIGLGGLTAIVVLILGDRIVPLLDVCTAANELIEMPQRRL